MASGKVKWFDNKRGFGFILQESGQDVFVHHTCIEGEGFKSLREGDLVNYELIPGERGPKAARVKRVPHRTQF
jgi:CspA family cold shock protein